MHTITTSRQDRGSTMRTALFALIGATVALPLAMGSAVHAQAGSGAAAASAPAAQSTTDPRWQPWIGCWQSGDPAARTLTLRGSESESVCVVPARSGRGVEVVTVAAGRVVDREPLDATGERVPVTRDGCEGWERTAWSADGRRLFRRAEVSCEGGTSRVASMLMAITPDAEWLRVEGIEGNGQAVARAVRLHEAPTLAIGDSVTTVLPDTPPVPVRGMAALRSPRLMAGGRVSVDQVLEATRTVATPVVEAWLTELQQVFELDAKQLVRLSDAGLSPRVIDVLVALSHPEAFRVRAQPADDRLVASSGRWPGGMGAFGTGPMGMGPAMMGDPWTWDRLGFGLSPFGLGGLYGSRLYGNGFFGGMPWGNGWYVGQTPVLIETPSQAVRARVVNGAGYTRGTGSGGSANPRQSGGAGERSIFASPRGSSSGGGGSVGGSSSGSSGGSSGGGSTGRTARPRGGGA